MLRNTETSLLPGAGNEATGGGPITITEAISKGNGIFGDAPCAAAWQQRHDHRKGCTQLCP
jgi:hypothetical protein